MAQTDVNDVDVSVPKAAGNEEVTVPAAADADDSVSRADSATALHRSESSQQRIEAERLADSLKRRSLAVVDMTAHATASAVHGAAHTAHAAAYGASRATRAARETMTHAVAKTRSGFYNLPKLVVDWHNREDPIHPPTWEELFLDICYVATIIKLSDLLKSDVSGIGVFRSFSIVMLLWEPWLYLQAYASKFRAQDAAHRIMSFLVALGVVGMGLHLGPIYAMDDNVAGLVASAVFIDLALSVMYVEVYHISKRTQHQAKYLAAGAMSRAVVLLASMALPGDWLYVGFFVATVVALFVTGRGNRAPESMRTPVHAVHFADRHGELVMVALGESVVSLLIPPLTHDWKHYLLVVCGLLLTMLLQTTYLECQPDEQAIDHHALRVSMKASAVFVHGHWVLFATLVGVGVGLKILLLHVDDPLHTPEAWLFCGSTAISLFVFNAMRASHKKGYPPVLGGEGTAGGDSNTVWACRWAVSFAPLLAPIGVQTHTFSALALVIIVTSIAFVGVIVDLLARVGEAESVEGVDTDAVIAAATFRQNRGGGRGHSKSDVEAMGRIIAEHKQKEMQHALLAGGDAETGESHYHVLVFDASKLSEEEILIAKAAIEKDKADKAYAAAKEARRRSLEPTDSERMASIVEAKTCDDAEPSTGGGGDLDADGGGDGDGNAEAAESAAELMMLRLEVAALRKRLKSAGLADA